MSSEVRNNVVYFYTIEHVFLMIIATTVVHSIFRMKLIGLGLAYEILVVVLVLQFLSVSENLVHKVFS